jgi:rubrerythrin
MPTLTPTAAVGATAKAAPMVSVDPARVRTDDDVKSFLDGSGLNGPFMADLLADILAHERCGAQLYRSVAGRTCSATLEQRYAEFGNETTEHVRILETLIGDLGGDPNYISPAARATEKSGSTLLESTFLLGGSLDPVTREQVMLEAVFLAETKDRANWHGLANLARTAEEGSARDALQAAVDQVESQEDEHLEWATSMRERLVAAQAKGPVVDKMRATADELASLLEQLLA